MNKPVFLRLCLALGAFVFSLDVSASDNFLTNPGLDSNLSGWSLAQGADGDIVWSNQDANGSPSSGSALVTNSFTDGGYATISQCILLPGSGPFDAGARFFLPSGQGQSLKGFVSVSWYGNTGCSGKASSISSLFTPLPSPTDSWTTTAAYRLTPPAGAVAAHVNFGIAKADSFTGPTVLGYVDETFFRPTSCTPSDADLCLNGGRFRVTAQWESPNNGGIGHGVQFNDESGYFWFFESVNTEVVVKVHGACVDPYNRYWVFAAGLTNVLVTLNVEDTVAGVANQYINPQGTAFLPLQDTSAFDTCP